MTATSEPSSLDLSLVSASSAASDTPHSEITRRAFLKNLLIGAAAVYGLRSEEVYAKAFAEKRPLVLHNLNTRERFTLSSGPRRRYDKATLQRLNHFLRDHRNGQMHAMDPALLEILTAVTAFTHSKGPIEVICGYRSPQSNEFLHQTGGGVAGHSLHMAGKAVDIRLSDVNTNALRKAGVALKRGGVGYYRDSDFVHLDSGPVRIW